MRWGGVSICCAWSAFLSTVTSDEGSSGSMRLVLWNKMSGFDFIFGKRLYWSESSWDTAWLFGEEEEEEELGSFGMPYSSDSRARLINILIIIASLYRGRCVTRMVSWLGCSFLSGWQSIMLFKWWFVWIGVWKETKHTTLMNHYDLYVLAAKWDGVSSNIQHSRNMFDITFIKAHKKMSKITGIIICNCEYLVIIRDIICD